MKVLTNPSFGSRKYIAFIVIIISFLQPLSAQQKLPIIRATSRTVDIRDGEVYQKGIWNLSPENNPDIYLALGPLHEKKITFYTDIDSISFDIIPGSSYDFIILLNGKDSCYTKISTKKALRQTELNTVSLKNIKPDLLKQGLYIFSGNP